MVEMLSFMLCIFYYNKKENYMRDLLWLYIPRRNLFYPSPSMPSPWPSLFLICPYTEGVAFCGFGFMQRFPIRFLTLDRP